MPMDEDELMDWDWEMEQWYEEHCEMEANDIGARMIENYHD